MATNNAVIGDKAIRLPSGTGVISNDEREFGNVMIRHNSTSGKPEYSTDGRNWTDFGAGSGSSSGSGKAIETIFYGSVNIVAINVSQELPANNGTTVIKKALNDTDIEDDDYIHIEVHPSDIAASNHRSPGTVRKVRGKVWKDLAIQTVGGNDSTRGIELDFSWVSASATNNEIINRKVWVGKLASGGIWIQGDNTVIDPVPLIMLHMKASVAGSGGGSGLFSADDPSATMTDADKVSFLDADDSNNPKSSSVLATKESLATPVIVPERTIRGEIITPASDRIPAVPAVKMISLPDASIATSGAGENATLSAQHLNDHDWLWAMAEGNDAIPFMVPISELKARNFSDIRASNTKTFSWTRGSGANAGTGILNIDTGDFLDVVLIAGSNRVSSSPTSLTPSNNRLTITAAQLVNDGWVWFLPGDGFAAIMLPTNLLKMKNFPYIRTVQRNTISWTLNAQKTQGEFVFPSDATTPSKVLIISGDIVSSSPLTYNHVDNQDTRDDPNLTDLPDEFELTVSSSQLVDNEFIWFMQDDGDTAGSYTPVVPTKVLRDNSSIAQFRQSGGKYTSWTNSTRKFSSLRDFSDYFAFELGGPGSPEVPAVAEVRAPDTIVPESHSLSLRRGITIRTMHEMSANGNATDAMLQSMVVVTTGNTARTLTFPDNYGVDGNEMTVINGNATSTNLTIAANSLLTGNSANKVLARNASQYMHKLSGKWYIIE